MANILTSKIQVPSLPDDTLILKDAEARQDLSTALATATGNPLNFSTRSAQKAKETVISLEPIQDLHGYDHPWPAGGGKNKADSDGLLQATDWVKNTDGSYTGSNSNLNYSKFNANQYILHNILDSHILGKNYTISFDLLTTDNSLVIGLNIYNTSTETNRNEQVMVTSGTRCVLSSDCSSEEYVSSLWFSYNFMKTITISNLQFEEGSTATDYAPYSNICPIDGRTETSLVGCGANIWDEEWEEGNINTNTGQDEVSNLVIRSKGYISCFPDTEYYFLNVAEQEHFVFFYRDDKTYISRTNNVGNGIFETPEDCYFIRFRMTTPYGNIYNGDISINYPSTDHVYHPFVQSNNITIQFGEKVYGGTLDVETGELVVDKGYVIYDGSSDENWSKYRIGSASAFAMTIKIADMVLTSVQTKIIAWSNMFRSVSQNKTWGNYNAFISNANYANDIICGIKSITTLEDWKTYLSTNNLQVVYELATPRTITLTPNEISLLLGVNNISTDGDSIKLTYRDGKVATLGDLDGLVKKIADCEDVEITDLQADDSLVWDATAGKWKNQQNINTHVYSTTEQVVGTWVDGSTIYEKTITGLSFTTVLDGWADSGASLSDVDKVIRCECGQNVSSMIEICFAKVDSGELYIWTTNRVTYEFNNIVIQYTKNNS